MSTASSSVTHIIMSTTSSSAIHNIMSTTSSSSSKYICCGSPPTAWLGALPVQNASFRKKQSKAPLFKDSLKIKPMWVSSDSWCGKHCLPIHHWICLSTIKYIHPSCLLAKLRGSDEPMHAHVYNSTWKRALRHNDVHFFDISISKSGLDLE